MTSVSDERRPLRHTFIVDASYDYEHRLVGIGLVVHQTDKPRRKGVVIDEIFEAYLDVPSGAAEMFAVLRALEIAAGRGFRKVKVRSDYNSMRRQLKELHRLKQRQDKNDLQSIILRLATCFDEVKFAYQPRRKNHVAHRLARKAVKEAVPLKRPDLFPLAINHYEAPSETRLARAAKRPVSRLQ